MAEPPEQPEPVEQLALPGRRALPGRPEGTVPMGLLGAMAPMDEMALTAVTESTGLMGRAAHRAAPVIRVYRGKLACLEPRARKVMLELRAHPVTRAPLDSAANKEFKDRRVYPAQQEIRVRREFRVFRESKVRKEARASTETKVCRETKGQVASADRRDSRVTPAYKVPPAPRGRKVRAVRMVRLARMAPVRRTSTAE